MPDAALHKCRRFRQPANFRAEDVHQLGLGVRAAICEGMLDVFPDALVGVELWSVGREGNEMQTRRVFQKFLDRITSMDCAVVEQNNDMTVDLTQQMAEEHCDLLALDVVFVELAIQRAPEKFRADCDAGDRGDTVMAVAVGHDRRLADGAPRLMHRRDQEKPGFVYKNDVGTQPRGVFFTRGQTCRFQSSMAASLRSRARSSGFWWLQPNRCRSLPT